MVDIVNNIYTKDFKDFGSNWLWTKDSKGNRIDWAKIDKDKSYGEIKEVSLCGGETGSTDVESTKK